MASEILIVEDDEVIAGALAYNLTRAGYAARRAADAPEALRLFRALRPDLVLLDLMLPGGSGIEVCRRMRDEDGGVAIVMVTAKGSEEEKVRGLEAGADDYVTKPFGMRELLARVRANLRRGGPGRAGGRRGRVLESGSLRLDTGGYVAALGGEPLALRVKEFELLAALAARPGELMSREDLAKEVWGHAGVGSSRTIDVHVRRVRAALEAAWTAVGSEPHEFVRTARGLGYRFEPEPVGDLATDEPGVGAERPSI